MEILNEPLCVICLEPFKQERKAMSLHCGHSYCKICLNKMLIQQKIICPECRKSTSLKEINELSTNISLMRLMNDSENRQQQNMFADNLKQLRKKIVASAIGKIELLQLYAWKIQNHKYLSLHGFMNEAEALKQRFELVQQFKEVENKDIIELNRCISTINETLDIHKMYSQKIEEGVKHLKTIIQTSNVTILLLDLEKYHHEISTLDEIYLKQEDRKRIDQQMKYFNEISKGLRYLERKYSSSLSDLKCKENVKLNDIIDGLEWDMKFSKFRLGFVGNSGKAKSSLINRLRNLPDLKKNAPRDLTPDSEYEIAAPTGTGETTRFPVKYSWKNKPSILLKDFPGFGLASTVEEYVDTYLENDNCHMYVILYTERLTKNDIKLAKLIKTSLKKPVILARSKTDIDYMNILDEDDDLIDKSEQGILSELKRRLVYELNQQEFDTDFDDDTFKRQDLKVFLISAKQGNEQKFEMKELIKEIYKCFPDELSIDDNVNRSNVFLNLSKNEIKNIKEKLKQRIVGLSALSAATDIVPIAGQLADLGILIGEVTRYRDYFCLKKEYIDELGKKYKIPDEKVTDIIKIVALDAKYMNIKNFVLTITGAVSIGLSVAQAVTSAVSLGINIATFGAGCFISALISGPISYFLCKDVLEKALDQMEKDSLQIIELIHEEIKNKEE